MTLPGEVREKSGAPFLRHMEKYEAASCPTRTQSPDDMLCLHACQGFQVGSIYACRPNYMST
jgi:hypothetical protein